MGDFRNDILILQPEVGKLIEFEDRILKVWFGNDRIQESHPKGWIFWKYMTSEMLGLLEDMTSEVGSFRKYMTNWCWIFWKYMTNWCWIFWKYMTSEMLDPLEIHDQRDAGSFGNTWPADAGSFWKYMTSEMLDPLEIHEILGEFKSKLEFWRRKGLWSEDWI